MIRLDFEKKHETSYCIPLWLRDEQVRLAIARVAGRVEPYEGTRSESVAVVGFAPSLRETWEAIRKYPYVITCSGAHRFLIDRGIVPTWHVEVDPRAHKITLLGAPHPDVEYLPSSTCHPDYFAHLKDFKVRLWHVFSNEDEVMRLLPPGEWALTGGPDVTMRAIVLSRFLGFRTIHVFGMDGCVASPTIGDSHASEHPNSPRAIQETEYAGRTWHTTIALLECAKAVTHELDMLPDCDVHFHGEGLVQAIARKYQRQPAKGHAIIGISKPELISAAYREQNRILHDSNLAYGVGGGKHSDIVLKLAESMKTRSVLDYGAGKGYLAKKLPFPIWEYDPAIPGKETPPRPADLVVCTDVLEHIEPDKILAVLNDLQRCVLKVGYLTIHLTAASKTLPDGRNTHLLIRPRAWWEKMLGKFFTIGQVFETEAELRVVVGPTKKQKRAANLMIAGNK